jgi:PAS domain-containing protein
MKKEDVQPDMVRTILDALPSLIFVVDEDVRIQDYNAAAEEFVSAERAAILRQRGGDVLHCVHARDVPEGCGRGPSCERCVVRGSVVEAFKGKRVVRRRTRMEIHRGEENREIYALVTASPFRHQERALVLLVIEDISEIAELRRLIPICSVCKKVRDEQESWSRVETYFMQHWDVYFSHGLCPECYQKEIERIERDLRDE